RWSAVTKTGEISNVTSRENAGATHSLLHGSRLLRGGALSRRGALPRGSLLRGSFFPAHALTPRALRAGVCRRPCRCRGAHLPASSRWRRGRLAGGGRRQDAFSEPELDFSQVGAVLRKITVLPIRVGFRPVPALRIIRVVDRVFVPSIGLVDGD